MTWCECRCGAFETEYHEYRKGRKHKSSVGAFPGRGKIVMLLSTEGPLPSKSPQRWTLDVRAFVLILHPTHTRTEEATLHRVNQQLETVLAVLAVTPWQGGWSAVGPQQLCFAKRIVKTTCPCFRDEGVELRSAAGRSVEWRGVFVVRACTGAVGWLRRADCGCWCSGCCEA